MIRTTTEALQCAIPRGQSVGSATLVEAHGTSQSGISGRHTGVPPNASCALKPSASDAQRMLHISPRRLALAGKHEPAFEKVNLSVELRLFTDLSARIRAAGAGAAL